MATGAPPQSGLSPRDGTRGADLLTFDEVMTPEQMSSHEYKVNIHVEYSFGPSAHGGFLVSAIWRCVQEHFQTTHKQLNQPDTFALHTEFLKPVGVGEARVHIKDVRIGKASSTVHATLIQKDRERVMAFVSNAGPLSKRNTLSINMGHTFNPPLPPIDFPATLANKDPYWQRLDMPREPSSLNHALCNVISCIPKQPPSLFPAHRSTTVLWICPRIPEEKWKNSQLGIVFDMSPPTVENFMGQEGSWHGQVRMAEWMAGRKEENAKKGVREGWTYEHPPWMTERGYPTVNMSCEIKRQLPPEGEKWLLLRWHTKELIDGRFDVDAEIWDTKGQLIGIAQMLWYCVDFSQAPKELMGKKNDDGKGRFHISGKGFDKNEMRIGGSKI